MADFNEKEALEEEIAALRVEVKEYKRIVAERDALQRRVEALEMACIGAQYDLQAVLTYGGPNTSSQRVALEARVNQLDAALRGRRTG